MSPKPPTPITPLYRYIAIKDMHDKGMTDAEIGTALHMPPQAVRKALETGGIINKPGQKNVGLVHKWRGEYVYLMPGNVWLGVRDRKIVRMTGIAGSEAKVVIPHMTTEVLLKNWKVSHDDLTKAEKPFFARAKRGLPVRAPDAPSDADRMAASQRKRDARDANRDESLEAVGRILDGQDAEQVISSLFD